MTDERSAEDRLRDLKGLHEDGLITDDEYAEKRAVVIDQIGAADAAPTTPPQPLAQTTPPQPLAQTTPPQPPPMQTPAQPPPPPVVVVQQQQQMQMQPQKKKVNHTLHFILTILTAGLWLPVWIVLAIKNS